MKDSQDSDLSLASSITRNSDFLSGRIPSTATVKAPPADHLKVELVSLSLVKRLDEVNADSNILQGTLWVLIGGLLGVFSTIIIDGEPLLQRSKSTWVLITLLIIFVIIFALLWLRSSRRGEKIKESLYQNEMDL